MMERISNIYHSTPLSISIFFTIGSFNSSKLTNSILSFGVNVIS